MITSAVARFAGETTTLSKFIREAITLLPEYTWQRSAQQAYADVVSQLEEQTRIEVIVDDRLCGVLVLEDDVHVGQCLCIEAIYGCGNVMELFYAAREACRLHEIEFITYAKRVAPGRYLTVYRRIPWQRKPSAGPRSGLALKPLPK